MARTYEDLRPYLSEAGWAEALLWRDPARGSSGQCADGPQAMLEGARKLLYAFTWEQRVSDKVARERLAALAAQLPSEWMPAEEWWMSKV